jgi:acylphosphatase
METRFYSGFLLLASCFQQNKSMATQAKRIIVHGRVQGVGFRYFVQHIGTRLGLTGNVSNCPDSTVEITVEGNPNKIIEFINLVEKGPSLARVRRVDVTDIPVEGTYGSFSIEGW